MKTTTINTPETIHTPGPWVVTGDLDSLRVVNDNSDNPNACDGVRQVAHVVQGGYEIANYAEAEANARLIAAAPDMLAALEASLAEMRAFAKYWTSPKMGLSRSESKAEEMARAAIAKAKGAQP